MAVEPRDELMGSLKKLFIGGSYSDLVIKCGSDEHHVHRAIICPRSTFFAAACNGAFKESNTGVICLEEDDPQTVELMLYYLYHLDYPKQKETPPPVTPSAKSTQLIPACSKSTGLTLHAKIYAIAEKYDIQGLKTLALRKFKQGSFFCWVNLDYLQANAEDFLQAVTEVYTSTIDSDRGMRDVVVKIMIMNPRFLDDERVQNTVRGLDLCFDLMMHFRRSSDNATARRLLRAGQKQNENTKDPKLLA
ncbi:hypothetical protein B0I35DRAFT_464184 [Stachybotrys elegans]|uniref:BTB domain-containing protein n=1 Tax=Stachybotrys elegans TaxID=80388 RepID=A0A8K0SGG8_9HYPO|nr:hypothetical protein B0I35DRAFT_464184 [Stachybotrys elegans]